MWWTGTIDDQFTGIYLSLATAIVGLHGPITPVEVDQMDLTTIWVLMGIPQVEAARREAANAHRASASESKVVKLTPEEKAERALRAAERRQGGQ